MRIKVRLILIAFVVLAALTGGAAFILFSAARHEPQFYQQALQVEPQQQQEAGDQLEQSVLELHNSARKEGHWEAVFTETQINGWLAADLPDKFPQILPPGTEQPRVSIDPERIKIACRYKRGNVNTVISFDLAVNLTTETNTLAVRVSKVRAGALPVPLKRFLAPITKAGADSDIPLRWSQTEGDPVALVTVPHSHKDYAHREIYLETVKMRDGEVVLAGRTQRRSPGQHTVAQRSPVTPKSAGSQSGAGTGSANSILQR